MAVRCGLVTEGTFEQYVYHNNAAIGQLRDDFQRVGMQMDLLYGERNKQTQKQDTVKELNEFKNDMEQRFYSLYKRVDKLAAEMLSDDNSVSNQSHAPNLDL